MNTRHRRPPRRQNLRTAIRKEQIVQAALDVIAEHGVSELSLARVARRVGFVPSAIYRHFQRKDQILDAILEVIMAQLLENVKSARAEAAQPLKRLRLLAGKHVQMIRRNHLILRIVFSESVYGRRRAWRARIQDILQTYLLAVGDIVRAGQKAGDIRGDVAPAVVAVMFLGLIQPAAVLWHISGGRFNLQAHLDKAWKPFARGIASPC